MHKKPRKIINGIPHIQCACPGCDKWIPLIKNCTYRCIEHTRVLKNEHYERKKNGKIRSHRKQDDPEVIKRELEGRSHVGGLFSKCSDAQINAMLAVDVQALLKTKTRDE